MYAAFEEQLGHFVGVRQKALFERVAQRGIVGNVLAPGRRVAALDALLRTRAGALAALPLVDQEELIATLGNAMAQRRKQDDGAFRLAPPRTSHSLEGF